MKHVPMLVLGLAAIFMMASPTSASSSVDEVVAALEQTSVYIEPGTEDTNSDTAGVLTRQMHDGDNIVIIMLPAGSSEVSESDLLAMARQIDQSLEGDYIIGLSVGDQIVAYSASLPPGEATDLMDRADNVSVNTPETMSTFIRNVHDWQSRNPEAEASQPTKQPDDSSAVPFVAGGGGLLLAVTIVGAVMFRRIRRQANEGYIQLRSSPEPVRDLLDEIARRRYEVNDPHVRDTLTQACKDTEAFFARNSPKKGSTRSDDSVEFEHHLLSVKKVVDRYIDIQNNPRFFEEPAEGLSNGSEAITGFADYVLSRIRRGSNRVMTDYKVDTKILSAQRHR